METLFHSFNDLPTKFNVKNKRLGKIQLDINDNTITILYAVHFEFNIYFS